MHEETHGKRWCLGIASRVDDVFSIISKFPTFLFQGFYTSLVIITHIYIYLVGGFNPSEKYVRQLGLLFPTERKNKINVPSHQPNICIYIYIYQTESLKKGFTPLWCHWTCPNLATYLDESPRFLRFSHEGGKFGNWPWVFIKYVDHLLDITLLIYKYMYVYIYIL